MLFHPGPARIDCGQCQKFVHDMETGEVKTYQSTVDGERKELPQVRPAGIRTPCDQCPKQSPEKAVEFELSAKNWQAWSHYRQARSVGLTDAERIDPIVRRNFSIIDGLVKTQEQQLAARFVAAEISKLMPR